MVQPDMRSGRGKAGRGGFPEMKGYANTDRETHTHTHALVKLRQVVH